MKTQNLEPARLVCFNAATPDAPPLAYDPATGLFPGAAPEVLSPEDLATVAELEAQLGLPTIPGMTSRERVKRLAAAAKALPLSAQSKPMRPIRWTDSKGKSQVDLAAIFDREAAQK